MIIDSLLILLPNRCSVSLQFTPRRIFCTHVASRSRQTFHTISTSLESFPSRSGQKIKQDEYISSISEWKGAPHTTSKHVTHYIASGNDEITVESAIWSVLPNVNHSPLSNSNYFEQETDLLEDASCISHSNSKRRRDICQEELLGLTNGLEPQFRHDPSTFPLDRYLSPIELLAMGSIWFLPHTAPRDSSLGIRPIRLQAQDLTRKLTKGDYLRVHHNPRRFPIVSSYNWGKFHSSNSIVSSVPGTIVARDDTKGYIVVNKPGALPVHASVDNLLENVCAAIGRAMVKTHETPTYISAAQRLDQDTSGLFVVCTKPVFAAYFSKLLRNKTDTHLGVDSNTKEKKNYLGDHVLDSVRKKYKCLVCLFDHNIQGKSHIL